VVAAVARALAWLLPAERRGWAEAAWAEAHAVPPGLTRLAWRGMWVAQLCRSSWSTYVDGRTLPI